MVLKGRGVKDIGEAGRKMNSNKISMGRSAQ
jgi:hypothetical protein